MMSIAHPLLLYIGLPLVAAISYYRWAYYKQPVYSYSSLLPLQDLVATGWWQRVVPFVLRAVTLTALVLAIARIRQPDERTLIPVKGIDIMMVLDASGSMGWVDDIKTKRTRLSIAKQEAITFIKKRTNDPIGLVIFSGAAITRSPLTLDKTMLSRILEETTVRSIPIDGTTLSKGMLIGANRLKKSEAKSRIMIVLTDGVPSPNDVAPELAIELAQKLGIKIYTIGIGADKGSWAQDGWGHWVRIPGQQYDAHLLKKIAQQTGGQFFEARSAKDMAQVYTTIDQLERTEQQMPIYAKYYEYFTYFLWAALVVFLAELILTSLLWVRL